MHRHSRYRIQAAAVVFTALIAMAPGLSACGTSHEPQAAGNQQVIDKSWQVIGIYTAPDAPSAISDAASAAPSMTFGSRGIVGTSGCAQFKARASYFHGSDPSGVDDADNLHIDGIDWDSTHKVCDGELLWAHNQLTRLLVKDNSFDVRVDPGNQLILTLHTSRVDSPAIRFASLNKATS